MYRVLLSVVTLTFGLALAQPVTSPEQYFGFRIGADKKLARYDKIVEYLRKVAEQSDRVRIRTVGPTTQGNPFVVLEISSAENIRNLDRLKALQRKLYFQAARPQLPSATRFSVRLKRSYSSRTASTRRKSARLKWCWNWFTVSPRTILPG